MQPSGYSLRIVYDDPKDPNRVLEIPIQKESVGRLVAAALWDTRDRVTRIEPGVTVASIRLVETEQYTTVFSLGGES